MSEETQTQDVIVRKGWTQPDAVREPLYVCTIVTNPIRYKSRWKLYQRFEKHVRDAGGTLYTAEIAFGEREFAIDQRARHKENPHEDDAAPLHDTNEFGADCRHDDPRRGQHKYFRFRTKTELWMKERLANILVQRLPSDWRYAALIDCDVLFARPNWVSECIHQLQHYDWLQMFSFAHDLTPDYEIHSTRPSFIHGWQENGGKFPTDPQECDYYYYPQKKKGFGFGWSGLAWAFTRRGFETFGGFMDTPITGAGDWYQAFALLGQLPPVIPRGSTPGFIKSLMKHQEMWMRSDIRLNVGCMKGSVMHNHHGPKPSRKYVERSKLLSTYKFDPYEDLTMDSQGLWLLRDDGSERIVKLRDEIRAWFRNRNEDSPSLE